MHFGLLVLMALCVVIRIEYFSIRIHFNSSRQFPNSIQIRIQMLLFEFNPRYPKSSFNQILLIFIFECGSNHSWCIQMPSRSIASQTQFHVLNLISNTFLIQIQLNYATSIQFESFKSDPIQILSILIFSQVRFNTINSSHLFESSCISSQFKYKLNYTIHFKFNIFI